MNTQKQLNQIINELPIELQGQVIIWFQRLQEKYPSMTLQDIKRKEDLIAIIKLIACSDFVSGIFIKHWEYYVNKIENMTQQEKINFQNT